MRKTARTPGTFNISLPDTLENNLQFISHNVLRESTWGLFTKGNNLHAYWYRPINLISDPQPMSLPSKLIIVNAHQAHRHFSDLTCTQCTVHTVHS